MSGRERNGRPWHGMNWIRQDRRLAIYLRDGLKCVYCGAVHGFTLDHIKPVCLGGTNTDQNLVTACLDCNKRKGHRRLPREEYARVRGLARRCTKRHRARARLLIEQHGSCSRALRVLLPGYRGAPRPPSRDPGL